MQEEETKLTAPASKPGVMRSLKFAIYDALGLSASQPSTLSEIPEGLLCKDLSPKDLQMIAAIEEDVAQEEVAQELSPRPHAQSLIHDAKKDRIVTEGSQTEYQFVPFELAEDCKDQLVGQTVNTESRRSASDGSSDRVTDEESTNLEFRISPTKPKIKFQPPVKNRHTSSSRKQTRSIRITLHSLNVEDGKDLNKPFDCGRMQTEPDASPRRDSSNLNKFEGKVGNLTQVVDFGTLLQEAGETKKLNSFLALPPERKIQLSDCQTSQDGEQKQAVFDLISMTSAVPKELDGVSMASLQLATVQKEKQLNATEKKLRHIFAYTPSTNKNRSEQNVGFFLMHSPSEGSASMWSLPMHSPQSNKDSSHQASTDFSQEITVSLKAGSRPALQLDMKKVARMDDTFVVAETEFEEDTKSADEFKQRILNTNLIINKQRTSFGQSARRPSVSEQEGAFFHPTQKQCFALEGLELQSDEEESQMMQVPQSKYRNLDSVSSLESEP